MRCRLAAQKVNTYREDAFFTAAPLLEALGVLLLLVTAGRKVSHGRCEVMGLHAQNVHHHDFAEREVYTVFWVGTCGDSLCVFRSLPVSFLLWVIKVAKGF